jgi:hypothetical protein
MFLVVMLSVVRFVAVRLFFVSAMIDQWLNRVVGRLALPPP